jgi:hypothetical protein
MCMCNVRCAFSAARASGPARSEQPEQGHGAEAGAEGCAVCHMLIAAYSSCVVRRSRAQQMHNAATSGQVIVRLGFGKRKRFSASLKNRYASHTRAKSKSGRPLAEE